MSTRSILALQKGNKVRYCFLHWDGDNHGQTLKEMLDSEIEDLFNKLEPVERGCDVHLSHLYSKSYWDEKLRAEKIDWKNRGNKLTGKGLKDFESIFMRPQSTAYDPIVIEPKKDKDGNVIEKLDLDASEQGFYTTTRKSPNTVKQAMGGVYPFNWCEYVWFYNLDTYTITWFHDKKDWKKQQMKRRKRLTPKKFDCSWVYEYKNPAPPQN